MQRGTDTSDTLTLTHELKLKNRLTLSELHTDTSKCQRSVREVSNVVSVMCQFVEQS